MAKKKNPCGPCKPKKPSRRKKSTCNKKSKNKS